MRRVALGPERWARDRTRLTSALRRAGRDTTARPVTSRTAAKVLAACQQAWRQAQADGEPPTAT